MYNTEHLQTLWLFFSQNPNRAFKAADLVKIFDKEMNKATIYRKLSALEANKLIKKIYNPLHNCFEYQYYGCQDEHLHLICDSCNHIIHLVEQENSNFIVNVLKTYNFSIDKSSSLFFGKCKECKR